MDRRAAQVLNPTEVRGIPLSPLAVSKAVADLLDIPQNLQTPDELEEEDREAQAAVRTSNARRPSPRDLPLTRPCLATAETARAHPARDAKGPGGGAGAHEDHGRRGAFVPLTLLALPRSRLSTLSTVPEISCPMCFVILVSECSLRQG